VWVAWKTETRAALSWNSCREEALPTREAQLRFFSNADGPGAHQESRGTAQASVRLSLAFSTHCEPDLPERTAYIYSLGKLGNLICV